jgi:hypothetical protein
MRLVVPLIALLVTTAAAPPTSADTPDPSPGEQDAEVGKVRIDPTNGKTVCRDTIQQVRAERGLPWVDRGTAAEPDEPLLIATVDHRIDGCSVMVMRDDTSDVRPLPEPRSHRLMPAK